MAVNPVPEGYHTVTPYLVVPGVTQLLDFLQLRWTDTLLNFHTRPKTVRTPTYADVSQPIHTKAIGRWRNYEKHLAPHLALLAPHLRTFGYEP